MQAKTHMHYATAACDTCAAQVQLIGCCIMMREAMPANKGGHKCKAVYLLSSSCPSKEDVFEGGGCLLKL